MRWLKNSIILIVIIVILIGFLLIYKGNLLKSSNISLIPADASISEIRVDSLDIVREKNKWAIKSPIHYSVDKDYIKFRLKKLKELELGDYAVVDSLYYPDYGFIENSKRVSIFFDDDSVKFLVGKSAAVPDAFFLKKTGDKGIYTAYGFTPYFLSNKPFDWRDKSIVFLNKNEVDSLKFYRYGRFISKEVKADSTFNKALKQIYKTRIFAFSDTTKEKFPYKVILYASDKIDSFKISKQIGSYYILKNDSTIFKVNSRYMINLLNLNQKK